jgi:hypothetical protein
MLQKFCERATQMYYEFQTKKKSYEKKKTSKRLMYYEFQTKKEKSWKKNKKKQRTDVLPALGSASEVKICHNMYVLNVFPR